MKKESIAFIFDMDGTLVDNMKFHTQAWCNFFSELGIEMTEDEVHRCTSGTLQEIIRRICGNHLSDDEVAALGERKELFYRQMYRPHLKLIDGLKPFLDEARKLGILMAVATSAGQRNIDFVLNGLGIKPYFSALVGGDDVEFGKPHPETFLKASQRLDRPPEQCIVFEDTIAGIEAAQNAGMRAIAITTMLPAQSFVGLPVVQQLIEDYTSLNPASLVTSTIAVLNQDTSSSKALASRQAKT
jgi:beta-phosphoglucomutase